MRRGTVLRRYYLRNRSKKNIKNYNEWSYTSGMVYVERNFVTVWLAFTLCITTQLTFGSLFCGHN